MITTPPEMFALTSGLARSIWTSATIGVIFESGLADHLREPRTISELAARCSSLDASRIERCLELAKTVGIVVADGPTYRLADGVRPFADPPMRASLEADIRGTLLQALAFLDSAKGPSAARGWRHTDRTILQAQGDTSAGLAGAMKRMMIPTMGDLAARLERPDARFLDIGTGVGALAIAMCRTFPSLAVVGVDDYELPLSMARENVAGAGLGSRIDLRRTSVESLADEAAFDLAWFPSMFIPEGVLPAAVARVHAALRPGGWVLFLTGTNPAADAQQGATFALINDVWGGPVLSLDRAESLLKEAGFTSVRPLQGPAWAPTMVVGQRV